MVLTPDQKKRIAALDSGPAQPMEEEPKPVGGISAWFKGLGRQATPAQISSILFKILFILVAIGTAAYLIVVYDLQNINWKDVFTSGRGSPIARVHTAIQLQKKKTELWGKGQSYLLEGEYQEALDCAQEIKKLDPKDTRSKELIDDIVIANTHKAERQFESGDIEDALKNVRFALAQRSDYGPANELILEISDQLLVEAQAHAKKKEYAQLIMKAKEVLKINANNMVAFNLLMETNNELLDSAAEYYVLKQYPQALEKVLLAMAIDDKNPRTLSTFEKIRKKVEAPQLELHGIYSIGGKVHARVQIPGEKPEYIKEGQVISNFKVVNIDPAAKTVLLRQIHTGQEITLQQTKKVD